LYTLALRSPLRFAWLFCACVRARTNSTLWALSSLSSAAASRRAAASAASRLSTESDAPRVEEDVAGFALAGLDAAF